MATAGSAVVIVASMGGLLAARVLSDAYGRVFVVDRDRLPDGPVARRGVPQGRQLHVLLARGREAFDEIFPGLSDELGSLGAPLVDLDDEVHWDNDGYRMRRAPSGLIAVDVSRAPLEHRARLRVVRVGITYLSRMYRREPHHNEGLDGALTNAVPGAPRAGILAAMEDDQFAVALSGILGDEGLVRFAGTLAAPQIAEVVRSAVPTRDPVRTRFPASRRRRYERPHRLPDGHLVVADAPCSFDPIYGQGMTVAALEALLLRRLFARGRHDLARRFFRSAARLIDAPWSVAVGTDRRFPEVAGARSPKVRVRQRVHPPAARRGDGRPGAGRRLPPRDQPGRPAVQAPRPGIMLRVLRRSGAAR